MDGSHEAVVKTDRKERRSCGEALKPSRTFDVPTVKPVAVISTILHRLFSRVSQVYLLGLFFMLSLILFGFEAKALHLSGLPPPPPIDSLHRFPSPVALISPTGENSSLLELRSARIGFFGAEVWDLDMLRVLLPPRDT